MTKDVSAAKGPFHASQSALQNDLDAQLVAFQSMDSTGRILSRDVNRTPPVRLDHQMSTSKQDNISSYLAYRATFVDLYLAVAARCVTFGVGNFAYLATKISGTTCRIRHADFAVLDQTRADNTASQAFHQQSSSTPLCPI
jgi:hypothetical protein